jgi:hypothetical protein
MQIVRLTSFALLVLMPGQSLALRGVAPGSPCSALHGIESALGSKLLGESPRDTSISLFFEGRHRSQSSSISYTCESGAVVSQIISTEFNEEREAALFFSESSRELRAEFGEPHKDLDEPRTRQAEQDLGVPVRRFTSWVIGARVISLMLTQESQARWQVVISGP